MITALISLSLGESGSTLFREFKQNYIGPVLRESC